MHLRADDVVTATFGTGGNTKAIGLQARGTHAEVEKLQWAQKYGADTAMDLSTGGNLREFVSKLIWDMLSVDACPMP